MPGHSDMGDGIFDITGTFRHEVEGLIEFFQVELGADRYSNVAK